LQKLQFHSYPWDRSQRDLIESYPISPSSDWFKNGYGSIRWWRIRSAYHAGVIDEDFVTKMYCEWRDMSEYFMINGIDSSEVVRISAFVKACKRGNDLYLSMINRKFGYIDSLPPIEFFTDWGRKCTPMLFVTLTIDAARCSLVDAWDSISVEFNRFETLLRQKYGKFVKFRVWEAHESGYPHCHVVYYFLDRIFEVWEHFDKDNNRSFRIANKHRNSIAGMWSMGNIDIKGVQDTLGAFKEVKKYITKHVWSDKGDKTNAMLTLFRKQSYYVSQFNYRKHVRSKILKLKTVDDISAYISANIEKWAKRDFIGAIWGWETYMDVYQRLDEGLAEPAMNALVKKTMCNYNIDIPEIVRWEFVGFISGDDLAPFVPNYDGDWVVGLVDIPLDLLCRVNIHGADYGE
jgi:hypothetical protein